MFGTRKLGKTSTQRKALLRQLVTDLLENGKIETTFYRAKEVQPVVEKMITLSKKGGLANYRRALAYITKEDVAKKLFDEVGAKYADRNGGSYMSIRSKFLFKLFLNFGCQRMCLNKRSVAVHSYKAT